MAKPKSPELPSRSTDFSGWYNTIIPAAELAAYGKVSGTMVIRPYGYAIWERVQSDLDGKIKAAGVPNAYFPLFIPMDQFQQETEHVKGFAPHLAVVTHGGGKELREPFAVRPTSETIMYPYFKEWIHSYRDLPFSVNQWCNVVRWEQRTTLFLRTMEFLWQEGHTAHATHKEAQDEQMRAILMYQTVYRELLALPGYAGAKSESEKFPGADATATYEMLMPDGKALQGCTSHDLGQNFSNPKMYDITFQNRQGKLDRVWQTSWGLTTRSIGALIMAHGDDQGLRLPPRVAPVQAVIVPFQGKQGDHSLITEEAARLRNELQTVGVRIQIDTTDKSPSAKSYWHMLRGVPVRLELGPRELGEGHVTVSRRDTGEEIRFNRQTLTGDVLALLDDIQASMLRQREADLASNTHYVTTYEEFKTQMAGSRGMIRAFWCGGEGCEAKIKEDTKATTRCLPFDSQPEKGNCVHCGQEANNRWIFAQSY